jgi:YjbE family integral membrane protein
MSHMVPDWHFLFSLLSVVFIDLILAGDNAVVIALAVRGLPLRQRKVGIAVGAGVAVALRIMVTLFAVELLTVKLVKLIGGTLILWIAVKLFGDAVPQERTRSEPQSLWQVIWVITLADITMSTDNILALAGVSRGNAFLLVFGLGLSIPFVVFTSGLLARLMDQYPVVILIGAAILGRVGGDMLMTDPLIARIFHPPLVLEYAVQALCAVGVVIVGRLLGRMNQSLDHQEDILDPGVRPIDSRPGQKIDRSTKD